MPETRKNERIRSLLGARVIFNNGASTCDCIIRNFSTAGARLEIADSLALPTEFNLDLPHKGRLYRARIVWRGDGLVGIEFLDGQSARSAPDDGENDAERSDRLMKENTKLKAQILELRQRVAQLSGEE